MDRGAPRKETRRGRGSRRIRCTGGLYLAVALTALASPAYASPETLRVAIEDVVVGVADLGLSPITSARATWRSRAAASDNGLLQALYVVPAWLGWTGLQVVQAGLRVLTGALQLVPGIALFPFPADVPADFNVFRRGELLLDLENPIARTPPWLVYVPIVTPFAIDVRLAPISPWAGY